jgi:diaminohydroxyphosphoribosylaminopyrimidine deaminase/5-amino-6-(5-phosphoribosylamino)uracil reductase
MKKAGIEVVVGVLENECYAINSHFFTYNRLARPAVTLKWAQTADGFIDVRREGGIPLHISTPVSQVAVHKLRSCHDAILVGTRTALLDNPSLNLRHWTGRVPLRLVIDRAGVLPAGLNLFDGSFLTVIYTQKTIDGKFGKNIEQVELDFSGDILLQILAHLHSLKVQSLLVEGGAKLLQSFIDASLWDCARVEINPSLVISSGVAAPVLPENSFVGREKCDGNEILLFSR